MTINHFKQTLTCVSYGWVMLPHAGVTLHTIFEGLWGRGALEESSFGMNVFLAGSAYFSKSKTNSLAKLPYSLLPKMCKKTQKNE